MQCLCGAAVPNQVVLYFLIAESIIANGLRSCTSYLYLLLKVSAAYIKAYVGVLFRVVAFTYRIMGNIDYSVGKEL